MHRRTVLRHLAVAAGAAATAPLDVARLVGVARPQDAPIVRTAAGRIRGFRDAGVFVFKGVRY
ncbi:MAG TPA: hypothetical protein VFV98_19825, partial [Vicinamibacterales bacterium]|nr:hypothetical protein [Vicinamibacterales bacterium]